MGSSSSSRSGCCRSSLHSATRRRSPPERTSTSASGGGQRSASIACSSWESMSHASRLSSSVWTSPISAISASKSASGSLIASPSSSIRRCSALTSATASSTFSRTVLPGGQRRLLQQDADRRVLGEDHVAVVGVLQAGHDLEQGRLAGAVRADDADLGARVERQRDVVQHELVAQRLADVVHRVDEFRHGCFRLGRFRRAPTVRYAGAADRPVCQRQRDRSIGAGFPTLAGRTRGPGPQVEQRAAEDRHVPRQTISRGRAGSRTVRSRSAPARRGPGATTCVGADPRHRGEQALPGEPGPAVGADDDADPGERGDQQPGDDAADHGQHGRCREAPPHDLRQRRAAAGRRAGTPRRASRARPGRRRRAPTAAPGPRSTSAGAGRRRGRWSRRPGRARRTAPAPERRVVARTASDQPRLQPVRRLVGQRPQRRVDAGLLHARAARAARSATSASARRSPCAAPSRRAAAGAAGPA